MWLGSFHLPENTRLCVEFTFRSREEVVQRHDINGSVFVPGPFKDLPIGILLGFPWVQFEIMDCQFATSKTAVVEVHILQLDEGFDVWVNFINSILESLRDRKVAIKGVVAASKH